MDDGRYAAVYRLSSIVCGRTLLRSDTPRLAPARPADDAGRVDQRSDAAAATEERQLTIPALQLLVLNQCRRQALGQILVRLGLGLRACQRR